MPSLQGTYQVVVSAADAGARLDRLLAGALADLTRNRLKPLIQEGLVTMGGVPVTDPARKVRLGEIFEVTVPDATEPEPEGEDIPLDIVFEDEHLIVVNKPAGMVVHPAAGNWTGTLVNALLYHCRDSLSGIGGVKRPGIVHRIDKDTSGLMVAAKTDAAHQGLAALFEAHDIERRYKAIVWGRVYPPTGEIDENIGRDPHNRKRMATVSGGGKTASTRYQLEENFSDIACLITCVLKTGRTHQIRVHMAHIGHPLVGDPVYTRTKLRRVKSLPEERQKTINAFNRQALHAQTLGFVHPVTDKPLKFEVDFPSDMRELVKALRG
ncbi:MAG: RluA family pseudouridine synthase [Sneathiella sp.]|nr:RluA family pseudouridine synthase [Sneathiella sp.]